VYTVEQVGQSSDRNSDSDELSEASSGTPRKRRKARQRDDNDLPKWTRKADIRRVTISMSHTAWAFYEGHASCPIYGHYFELYRGRK